MNKEHSRKCLIFEVATPFTYFTYLPESMRKFSLALQPPMLFVRIDTKSAISAEIKMHEHMLKRAGTKEKAEFLNATINNYKSRIEKGREYLEYALEALKQGVVGIRIKMFLPKSKRSLDAFLWKWENRYFGVVDFYSPDALLNSTSFKDAKNFANKWFHYIHEGKQNE